MIATLVMVFVSSMQALSADDPPKDVPAKEAPTKSVPTSYAPVDIKEDFATIMSRMKGAKPEVMKRQMDSAQ